MNLVEKLLAVDKGVLLKDQTETMKSKMLARVLGEEKTVEITIKALSGDEFTNLTLSGSDDEGNWIPERAFDTNAKIVAAGLVEPDLKNKALLDHVGAATPAEAAKLIFKGEINVIAMNISKLSGFGEPEQETVEKVKN